MKTRGEKAKREEEKEGTRMPRIAKRGTNDTNKGGYRRWGKRGEGETGKREPKKNEERAARKERRKSLHFVAFVCKSLWNKAVTHVTYVTHVFRITRL
jgi:hypothetical protein